MVGTLRLAVLTVTLIVAPVACSSGEDVADDGSAGATTTTAVYPRWRVTELDDGYEIDGGSYRLLVSTEEGLRFDVVDPERTTLVADPPAAGLFVVVDGVTQPVVSVSDTLIGVDHVTFEVSFGTVGDGRVEVAADGNDAVAVRVSADASSEVTDYRLMLVAIDTPGSSAARPPASRE